MTESFQILDIKFYQSDIKKLAQSSVELIMNETINKNKRENKGKRKNQI